MLRMEKITRRYGDNSVLEDFCLSVKKGEAAAVVGKSGCGKTTLLRILAGLDPAYQGQVFIDGKPAEKMAPRERNLAMVFQETALWNHMTVEENICFPLGRRGRKLSETSVPHICRELEIDELMKRFPGEISGGQARRVALARALAAGKEILLLDEPLSNVDERTRDKIMDFLMREYIGEKTLVYVSHDREEAAFLCSRTIEL